MLTLEMIQDAKKTLEGVARVSIFLPPSVFYIICFVFYKRH